METTTNFQVYLQALGGKFLGPNAYQPAEIKVKLKTTAKEYDLPYFIAADNPDDGGISPAFLDGLSSFMPILTNHPTKAVVPLEINYLTPNLGKTVVATGQIELPTETETAELKVFIPIPMNNETLELRQPVLLNKHQQGYKITVVVPGLLVHQPTVAGSQVSAQVTMMCGCKVSNGSTPPYWLPSDFEVAAIFHFDDRLPIQRTMTLDPNGNSSVFFAQIPMDGHYKSITITAQQVSTGNYGFNKQDF